MRAPPSLFAVILAASGVLATARVALADSISLGYDLAGNQVSRQTGVAAPPIIASAPTRQIGGAGRLVAFSVNVLSSQPATYQWYFNGVAIPGATGDSLYLGEISSYAHDGTYIVVVTNGSASSQAFQLGYDGNANGMPDNWELAVFGNLNQTAAGDFDGDGISNLDEYLNGTDPTVREVYYWAAASGNFNVAANWTRPTAPGAPSRVPGAGDTAVINSGTFTVPSGSLLAVDKVTVSVPFTLPSSPADFVLNVSGTWVFNGAFNAPGVNSLTIQGGGAITVNGPVNIADRAIYARSGSRLHLAGLTTYPLPTRLWVYLSARDAGSVLSFPNLTSIAGNGAGNVFLDLEAVGGMLDLPALTSITVPGDNSPYPDGGVRVLADGNGIVSAPLLESFNDLDLHPASSLTAKGGAVISAPRLLAPRGVDIYLNPASDPGRFTSLTAARFLSVKGAGAVTMRLASLSSVIRLTAEDGAQLAFPNLANYANVSGSYVSWTVTGANSMLVFPGLEAITGSSSPGCFLSITAENYPGAAISLPALVSIIKPDSGGAYANGGVHLSAQGNGTISAPRLQTFRDYDGHPDSYLSSTGGGTFIVPSLTPDGLSNVRLLGVILGQVAVSLPLANNAVIDGATWRLTLFGTANHAYQLQRSDSLAPVNWQNVGSAQSGMNAPLELTAPVTGGKMMFRVKITPWP